MLIKDLKSGEAKRLDVGGVFIEIGLVPNSEPVSKLIKLNKWGEVPVTPACETELPGLYAAGEGAKAILQAHRYLQRLD